MIEESYVSFETAKLLKKAGFDAPCYLQCSDLGVRWDNAPYTENFNEYDWGYSCPTQALAAKWLREVHNIHVVITGGAYVNGINYLWQVFIYNPSSVDCWDNELTGVYRDNGEYKTYEEALEAGLKYALELIKK